MDGIQFAGLRQRRMRSRVSIFLSLVLICLCPVGDARAQIRAGSVAELHHTAQVERSGRLIAATLGMSIMVGDKLQTSNDSSMTVALADGSQITLSDSSSVVIDHTAIGTLKADSVIEVFKGRLRSIVNSRADGSPPDFAVHTPNAVVAVRGTDFETAYIEGKPCPGFPKCLRYTDVGVYKGIVEIRNPTSSKLVSVRVSGGYETTVPCELPPANPGPLGLGEILGPAYH
jgi:ferric-dicitrate binding protein FerR (iron transport regulator)